MSRELEQIIHALSRLGKNVSEQENTLNNYREERDTLVQQLSSTNARVLELESQLSASLKASEAMRRAMEMAQEESRRWHEQCNALVQTLHAYSSSPPKTTVRDIMRSVRHEDDLIRGGPHLSSSQRPAKVEDELDLARTQPSHKRLHSVLGDVNDPRRHVPSPSGSRTPKVTSQHYHPGESHHISEYGPEDLAEESEDELNGITPTNSVQRVKQTPRIATVQSPDSYHTESSSHLKKRRVGPPGNGAKKAKR